MTRPTRAPGCSVPGHRTGPTRSACTGSASWPWTDCGSRSATWRPSIAPRSSTSSRSWTRLQNADRRPGFGRGVLSLPAQQVARLTLEHLAEGSERGKAHRLGPAVLEHGRVGGRDSYAVRELAH